MAKEESNQAIVERAATIFVNEKLARALGYVVVNWSILEWAISLIIKESANFNPSLFSIYFAESSFLNKLSIVSSLVHHSRKKEWFDQWSNLQKSIERLRATRNDLVHGTWLLEENVQSVFRIKSRAKLSASVAEITEKEVVEFYQEISLVTVRINMFRQELSTQNFGSVILAPKGPVLDRAQSPLARSQDQVRAQKKSKRQPPQGPKLSSAQKRALRETGKPKEEAP